MSVQNSQFYEVSLLLYEELVKTAAYCKELQPFLFITELYRISTSEEHVVLSLRIIQAVTQFLVLFSSSTNEEREFLANELSQKMRVHLARLSEIQETLDSQRESIIRDLCR